MHFAKERQRELKHRRTQSLLPESDAHNPYTRGQEQASSQQNTGMQRSRFAQFIAPASQIANDQRQSSNEASSEPSSRIVMAGKEEEDRENDYGVENQSCRHLKNHRAPLWSNSPSS